MTKKQVDIHGEIIQWFCDNADKGVWLRSLNGGWVLTYSPLWTTECKYVQNDEYTELRKAKVDGKLQWKWKHFKPATKEKDTEWKQVPYSETFAFYGEYDYRIKPDEPKVKVGDWVRHYQGRIKKATEDDIKYSSMYFELWIPQEGDVVILFNDNPEQFTIAKYQTSEDGKHRLISCSGKWTEIFKNCIPYIGQPFEEMK